MKTLDFKHYICLVMIAFAMGLVSCSDSDNELQHCTCVNPICEFYVYVIDNDSVSILNDSIQRSMYMEETSLKYYNVEYTCNQPMSEYSIWQGFIIARNYDSKLYCFRIGGWDGRKTYKNETVTLNWGNGTSDKLSFSNIHKCTSEKEEREVSYFLNGKEINTNHIFLIKERFPITE